MAIPVPDPLLMKLASHAPGNSRSVRLARRAISRLSCATTVITLRAMSSRVAKRFPDLESLENASKWSCINPDTFGIVQVVPIFLRQSTSVINISLSELLTHEERMILDDVEKRTDRQFALHWLPCQWMVEILRKMRE